MLKRDAYIFTSPVIYCYTYVDNTYGKACIVCVYISIYIWYFLIQLDAFGIQDLLRMHVETLCVLVQITSYNLFYFPRIFSFYQILYI
jgi:hypothetical protein